MGSMNVIQTKKVSILENMYLSSLSSAIFNVFLSTSGIFQLKKISFLIITETLLFVASFKQLCLFRFVFSIFSSFMHHTGTPTSKGINMALSQTEIPVTEKSGCWAGQSCPSPMRQSAATAFSWRLTSSHFLKKECVFPDCSIVSALASNILAFSC